MNFPELKLGRLAREKKHQEEKEDQKILNEYDLTEKDVLGLKINKVYEGKDIQKDHTFNDYVIVEHNGGYYPVMKIMSKRQWFYLLMDMDQLNMVKDFKLDGREGVWGLTNNHVAFTKKDNGRLIYLYELITGKGVSHVNGIKLDNRKVNLGRKTKTKLKSADGQIEKLDEPYRSYYQNNKSCYVNWVPSRVHGHRIFAGPCKQIKEKKFGSKDVKMIPILMKKAERYLLTEAMKYKITEDELIYELEPEIYRLKREYDQITKKAMMIFN